MSTGNVVASTRNSPTSLTDRKSRVTVENNVACVNVFEWQKIPKVEIVQHVDNEDGSGKESPRSPGKEFEAKNESGKNDLNFDEAFWGLHEAGLVDSQGP